MIWVQPTIGWQMKDGVPTVPVQPSIVVVETPPVVVVPPKPDLKGHRPGHE